MVLLGPSPALVLWLMWKHQDTSWAELGGSGGQDAV